LADIEQEGVEFYQGLSEGTKSRWVRALAEKLVEAELRHRKRFLEYARLAAKSASPDDNALAGPLPPEVIRLLMARPLAPKGRIKASAPYVSDEDALKMAIRAEEHIALLLTELRGYVPKNEWRYINRVIKEEWGHKASLEALQAKKRR
jgi:rubrerythrin